MQRSLEQELKEFEAELSKLLVRFMKICDAVEKGPDAPVAPATAKPVAPPPPKPLDLRAYV